MKLISISWSNAPRLPSIRATDIATIECAKANDALRGWKLSIRGLQCYLVSPPGWERDRTTRRAPDPKGAVTVYGPFPVNDVYLQWSGSEEELDAFYKGVTKYDSEPFGGAAPAPAAQDEKVPVSQLGDA